MSISKEVRIGVLVTVALVVFFTGFYFLKGADLFSNDKDYYCFYADVDGLQRSSMVQINGLSVGHVSSMQLAGDKGVKLTLSVNKDIDIPQGTISSLTAADLLGTKVIKLEIGKGPGMIPAGSELPTIKDGGLVDKLSGELTPRLAELKVTIASFNHTLDNVNNMLGSENQQAINAALRSLQATAHNLDQVTAVLSKESGQITSILHNANSITANLAKNNDTIQRVLANASSITRQLSNAPIQSTFNELHKTVAQLQGVMDKINNNQGSLGMIINNKDVYNNLNATLKSLDQLAADLKVHPSRYVNISLFGRKRKD